MPSLPARGDVAGVGLYLAVVALVAGVLRDVRAPDVQVYHLALEHLGADDVYRHFYPDLAAPYTYPPSALVLLAWLAVPLAAARVLMLVATTVSVWVTAAVVVRTAARGSPWDRAGTVGAVSAVTLLSLPLFLAAGLGQAAPVVMGLSAWGMLGARSRWRGAWVGTAAALKLTPAAFALHWWSTGRRRDCLVTGAAFLAWTALGWWAMPASSQWYYLDGGVLRAPQDYTNVSNQALSGIAARAGWESPLAGVGVLGVCAALLAAGLLVARRAHGAGWEAAAVALVGLWSGVCAPLAWIHAFGWWVPLAVAIALHGRTRRDVLVAVVTALWPAALLAVPTGPGPSIGSAWYPLGVVLVTTWLWRRLPARAAGRRGPSRGEPRQALSGAPA